MVLVLEQKTGSDGKVHDVLVVDNNVNLNNPEAQRDKLIHQLLETELNDIIATCKDIGSTNGHGGGEGASGSSGLGSSDAPSKSAIDAAKKAVQQAQEAVDKDKAKVNSDSAAYKQAEQQLQKAEAALKDLQSQLANAENELNQLKNALSHCPPYVKHWAGRTPIEKPNPEYKKLQNEVNAQQNVVNGLQTQVNTAQTAVNQCAASAENAKVQLDNDSNQLSNDQVKLDNAINYLNQLEHAGGGNNPHGPGSKESIHDIIWNHNVFWALLQIAMAGNSSVFGVLTEALGKIANEMGANQGVTQVITDINNDLQELVNFPKDPSADDRAKEQELIQDLQNQLMKLYYIVHPDAAATTDAEKTAKNAVKGFGSELSPELRKEAGQLFDDYTGEFKKNMGGTDPTSPGDPTGLNKMLSQMKAGNYTSFDNFLNDMVNRNGSGAPSASTNAIYSHTSGLITSLNTAGSEFMAQQNLEMKQIDQIEKLWTSGISTDKSLIQTVVGNIAN